MTREAETFLTTLWGPVPPGKVLVWMLPKKTSTWFLNFEHVGRFCGAYQENDIYTGVSVLSHDRTPNIHERATNTTAAAIPGLWADIDIQGPEHKKANLPSTTEAALDVLRGMEYQPTITVHSGHGLQCWWLFEHPWVFKDGHERALAQQLCREWHSLVAGEFGKHGWTVDATHDLARVMRLPGTFNHKSNPAKPVQIIETSDFRWREIPKPKYDVPITMSPGAMGGAPGGSAPPIGEFHINPDAKPPMGKLYVLVLNSEKARQTWERNRPDFKDGDTSPSVYDMALAAYAVQADWGDQEIVNLLIYYRRIRGDDLKLRHDYYRRTLEKVRQPRMEE